jgi:lysophospholipase L1-like esterase
MPTVTFTVEGPAGGSGSLWFKPRENFTTADGEIVTPKDAQRTVPYTVNVQSSVVLPTGPWQVSGLATQNPLPFDVDSIGGDLKDLIVFPIPPKAPATTLAQAVSSWMDANVNTEVTEPLVEGILANPESGARAALDGAYAPVDQAVPSGGATGQVLAKTASGFDWQTVETSGGGGSSFPALAPAATPCELIGRVLDFGGGFQRGAIAGDSTVNDGNDPPRKLLLRLAQLTDGFGLSERSWASGSYGAPVVVEPFVGTPSTGGTVFTDNLNRTAAELVGSTSSGGQVWAGGTGAISVNGTAAVGSGTNAAAFNCGSKAIATVGDYKVVTTNPASAAQARMTVGATQANFSTGGSYVWVQLAVTTSGVPQVSVWKRISGVNTQIGATATIAGLTASSATPQDLKVKAEIAIQAVTVTLTVGGVDQVINATVTEGDTAILGTFSGVSFPANTATTFALDNITMAIPFTAGTTGDGLEIWNAAVGGTTLAHQQTNMATMYPSGTHFDWLLVTGGHNHGTQEPAAFLAVVDSFIEAFKAAHPETLIVISSQNPQFAPATSIDAHRRRQEALRGYAMENGYEYLPVFEAFAAQPDGGASLVNSSDGIHPTVTTSTNITTWCGNILWAAVWLSVINTRRAGQVALTALPA